MAEVLGTVWLHVGLATAGATGGPTVPDTTVLVPLRTPFDPMLVMATGEQLTGMSLPRNNTTGWLVSALHSSIDAREPAVKCWPDSVTTLPADSPVHDGAEGFELSHVTPAAVDVMLNVCVAADALVTLVASNTLPMTIVNSPVVASNLEVRLTRSTSPPKSARSCGSLSAPPLRTVSPVLPAAPVRHSFCISCW